MNAVTRNAHRSVVNPLWMLGSICLCLLVASGCAHQRAPQPTSQVTQQEDNIAVDAIILLTAHGTVVELGSNRPLEGVGAWFVFPGQTGLEADEEISCIARSDENGVLGFDLSSIVDARSDPPDLLLVLIKPGYVPRWERIRTSELKKPDVDLGTIALKPEELAPTP